MLAPAPAVTAAIMSASLVDFGYRTLDSTTPPGQRHFKKHKVLPRPHHDAQTFESPRRGASVRELLIHTSSPIRSDSQSSSPHTLKHQPKRIERGPDLPPTPPNHSRDSSSSHSAIPSSPTLPEDVVSIREPSVHRTPATPPDQRSPPTPDVTPPQPSNRPRALRPFLVERSSLKVTPTESRTQSFTTAREEPLSSGEEDGQSAIRRLIPSASTSQTTVRQLSDTKKDSEPQSQTLDLALEHLESSTPSEDAYTPLTRREFQQFDGDWTPPRVLGEETNASAPIATMSKKPFTNAAIPGQSKRGKLPQPIPVKTSTPSKPPITVRPSSAKLEHATLRLRQGKTASRATQTDDIPIFESLSKPARSCSGTSGKSRMSSAGEAVLWDEQPMRRRTLRHVRKSRGLRDSVDSSPRSTLASQDITDLQVNARKTQEHQRRHGSIISVKSVSDGKARREVLKSGGLPVVLVPNRISSSKSKLSREPSLRSTSSRRSGKTISLRLEALERLEAAGTVPSRPAPLDRPVFSDDEEEDTLPDNASVVRRARRFSESDPSDIRTIDYPPAIPRRSSSLSAPTSQTHQDLTLLPEMEVGLAAPYKIEARTLPSQMLHWPE